MTPKERAEEIFKAMSSNTVHFDAAIQCSLFAVDLLMPLCKTIDDNLGSWFELDEETFTFYWSKVKYELLNMKSGSHAA